MEDRVFISNIINPQDFVKDKFNLIASGCGTGKTKFVSQTLPDAFSDVALEEILLVTSRSLVSEQQAKTEERITKYSRKNLRVVKYWNHETDDIDSVEGKGIQIMTYDKIIEIISMRNPTETEVLERIKIIVFDECHAMFSDQFIPDTAALRIWIRDTVRQNTKYIVGLTATPDIIFFYRPMWGVEINQVNKEVLPGYVANQLICTNFETVPYLFSSGQLIGRTIVMCHSLANCRKLQQQIPNSTILISPNNKEYTRDMDIIRSSIIMKGTLPDYYTDTNGERRVLETLLTTSTAREGFNLCEGSGVRNVVCCYGDPLHVVQFAGRARYNLDKIVVADTYIPEDNMKRDMYLVSERKEFKEFLHNYASFKWFSNVRHLVKHGLEGVLRICLSANESKFISYINGKWLVPVDATQEEIDKRKIWRMEDKDEIVDRYCECKITDLARRYVSFNRVITNMEGTMGYKIDSARQRIGKEQKTYKLVVSYDEEKARSSSLNTPIENV